MYSQNFDNGKNDMVKNGENLDSNNTTMMLLIQFVSDSITPIFNKLRECLLYL
jgi:hypothetical protein